MRCRAFFLHATAGVSLARSTGPRGNSGRVSLTNGGPVYVRANEYDEEMRACRCRRIPQDMHLLGNKLARYIGSLK